MSSLIAHATIVDDGRRHIGSIVIDGDHISQVLDHPDPPGHFDHRYDASGCLVVPGVIDTHVHFREPGLTTKADIGSESRAAAYGGVTTYFDMPNTVPQTVTPEAHSDKMRRARESSHVNYAFFFGATNDNADLLPHLDTRHIPGVKLFMGSSTGNMLVDSDDALRRIFSTVRLPIVAHCEDSATIEAAMQAAIARYGDDPPVSLHPTIRSAEACLKSTTKAVALAREYGARLHVAHLSTAAELQLFEGAAPTVHGEAFPLITAEAVIAHLMFTDADYERLGALIKCNPAVKTATDRDALRRALTTGVVSTVATDHAPHCRNEKEGGCRRAASGMPMVQFSLPCMMELADEGWLTVEQVVTLMCNNPARLFGIEGRGFLRPGYKADLVVLSPTPWTVTPDLIQSRCGWSPLTGHRFGWQVRDTFCNGHHLLDRGHFDASVRGEAITFSH